MMSASDWRRGKALFLEAIELSPESREDFLRSACGRDDELLRHVLRMLAADDSDNSYECWHLSAPNRLSEGEQLGPWKIVRLIGRGGQAEVYLARRTDGTYDKDVAIKLVHAPIDRFELTARLRRERQILASLDHPGISRIIDAGATADGAPYLVMEFIEGIPVDQYCVENRLSVTQRIDLFIQVCGSVRYVHQQAIVHRDIKPGNLLVTRNGQPKLLDFGTARLFGDGLSVADNLTRSWMRVMTPQFASPEQFRGEPVSTATDVYALGTLLYLLLTGRMPFEIEGHTVAEAMLMVCEREPLPPSAAVDRDDRKLRRELSGDLDNILLKALQKDPSRRYASVESFEDDLRRHREGLPVRAREASVLYRAAKLARRHAFAVSALALILICLSAGIAATLWQARIAEQRFRDVRGLAHSFIFDFHDQIRDMPGAIPLRRLFVSKATAYLDELSKQNSGGESLQLELAEGYNRVGDVFCNPDYPNLGEPSQAIAAYRKSETILTGMQTRNPQVARQLVETLVRLVVVHVSPQCRSELKEAAPYVHRAVAVFSTIRPGSLPDEDFLVLEADVDKARAALASLVPPEGNAAPWFQKEVNIREKILRMNPNDPEVRLDLARALANLTGTLEGEASIAVGLRELEFLDPLYRMTPGNQTVATQEGLSHYRIALTYSDENRYTPAKPHAEAAVSAFSDMVRRDPANMQARKMAQRAYRALSKIYQAQGDLAASDRLRLQGIAFVSGADPAQPSAIRELDGRSACPSGEPRPLRSADSNPLRQPGKLLVSDLGTDGEGALVVVDMITGKQNILAGGGFFTGPEDASIAADGAIYVSDVNAFDGSGGVIRLTFSWTEHKWLETPVACGGFFRDPGAIVSDGAGGLLVGDRDGFNNFHGRIVGVDPATGSEKLVAEGYPLAQLPMAMRLSRSRFLFSNFWSTAGGAAAILSLDLQSGKIQTVSQLGRFEDPQGIVKGDGDNIFVSDEDKIFTVDLSTGSQRILAQGGLLGRLRGMVRLGEKLYVAATGPDGTRPSIVEVDIQTGAQRLVTQHGFLSRPNGLTTRE